MHLQCMSKPITRWKGLSGRPAWSSLPPQQLPKEAGFSHVMLAILDSNKGFSTASLQALHTAGDLAAQNRCGWWGWG